MNPTTNTEAGAVADVAAKTREVNCPRCTETCGWCGDYRFMHGKIRLPGSRAYCDLPEPKPEGDACPVCAGSRRVSMTATYRPIQHLEQGATAGEVAAGAADHTITAKGAQP